MRTEVKLFTSKWCGPCKIYKPLVHKVLDNVGFKFDEYDSDIDPDIFDAYSVKSVPMLIILSDGKVVASIKGAVRKSELINKLVEWSVLDENQS